MSNSTRIYSSKFPLTIGAIALAILVLGVGVWGSITKISGAVIASGIIQIESLRQVVQHPDGGVVSKIGTDDGQRVQAGDLLVQFDGQNLLSDISILTGQKAELEARRVRLRAERDDEITLRFADEFLALVASDAAVADIMKGQVSLFQARLQSFQETENQLSERKQQIALQVKGGRAQIDAIDLQLDLIREERKDQEDLLSRGLAQATRVLALKREEARLAGERGQLESTVALGAAQQIEIDIEVLRLASQRRERAETELQNIEAQLIEINEQLSNTKDTFSRLDVRAPVSGIVYGMSVNTIRSVVRPAEPILYIVPQDQPFVVQTQISAIHVDQVNIGQEASLRFSTFDQRVTPEIFGNVSKISADIFQDERTGASYYSAEILPQEGELARLGDVELLPGMPVEAFIKTTDRTPLSYLTKPFTDYINRAFRE